MRQVPLNELVLRVARSGPDRLSPTFTYVDLSSIDATAKAITAPAQLGIEAAPSRARQKLAARDVLVSTVRPNLNGVACVPDELDGAIGSTGFSVLRADSDLLDHRYLFHWVRTAEFVGRMTRLATGASYPAVTDAIVRSSTIPLPPLPEQRRIAAILDEADSLRALHERELKHLDALVDACFTSIFGSDGSGPRVALRSLVASSQLGLVRGAKELGSDRQTPYMRMDAIEPSGRLRLTGWSLADTSAAERTKYSLRGGDFLFNTRNSREWVGKAAVVPKDIDGVYNNNILRLRFADPDVSEYLSFLWRRPTIRRQLDQVKSGTTSVFAIYARDLMEVQIPLPSASDLRDFTEASTAIRCTRTTTEGRSLDELFASLQHRAFRGEL